MWRFVNHKSVAVVQAVEPLTLMRNRPMAGLWYDVCCPTTILWHAYSPSKPTLRGGAR
jgi:hypothetical protein